MKTKDWLYPKTFGILTCEKKNHRSRVGQTLVVIFLLTSQLLLAQTDSLGHRSSKLSRFTLGYNLNQFQHDFGIGLNLTSPYFFHHQVALRVSGNLQWLQNVLPFTAETTWSHYGAYKAGVTSIGAFISKSIRMYGEGGLVLIVPNKDFSSKSTVFGGYGLFGFSFFVRQNLSYFIEMGGIGTGAVAEKSLYKPIYANGFTTSVGIRISL